MATTRGRRAGNGVAAGTAGVPGVPMVPAGYGQPDALANLPAEFPGGVTEALAPTETEQRREEELEAILQEAGTDTRVRVYNMVNGREAFAGELSAEAFSMTVLLEHYGGGEKTLRIYQGKTKKDAVRVYLDPSVPARSPRQAELEAEQRLKPGAGGGLGDMAAFIAAMANSQMASVNNMQLMMQSQQRQSADMMAAMQSNSNNMVTMLTGLLTAQSANKTDPLELVTKVVELTRPKEAPGMSDWLNMFEKGLKIGQAAAGGGNEDSVTGIVKAGVEGLAAVAQSIAATRAPQPPTAAPGEAVYLPPPPPMTNDGNAIAGTIGPSGATVGTPADDPNARPWLRKARTLLRPFGGGFAAASRFMSEQAAADTIIRALNDEEYDDLLNDLEAPGIAERLPSYFPMDGVNPEWLGGVVRELLLSAQEEPAPDKQP